MAKIAWTDVVAWSGSLSSTPESKQLDILAFVNEAVDVNVFGGEDHPTTRLARILMAAHLGASTTGNSGVTGAVTSESIGGMSRSYSVAIEAGNLSKTSYGSQYAMLVRNSRGRLPFVP